MKDLEFVGEPQPHDGSTASLPPRLAALVEERGEGLLCGSLWLVAPGSAKHRRAEARFQEARRMFAGTAAWLELLGPRAARLVLVGESGDGSFLLADPDRSGLDRLTLFHRGGCSYGIADDLPQLVEALSAKLLPSLESAAIKGRLEEEPDLIEVPRIYDSQADAAETELARCLRAGDDDARDVAFERFARSRVPADLISNMRRLLADPEIADPVRKEWASQVDRMEKRNPLASMIIEARAKRPNWSPVLKRMADAGLRAGGEVTEVALHAFATDELLFSADAFLEALGSMRALGAQADTGAVERRLGDVFALEAFVVLAAAQRNRLAAQAGNVDSSAGHLRVSPRNQEAVISAADLPSLERTWPVVLLGAFHATFNRRNQCLTALASLDEPVVPRVLEVGLLEDAFDKWARDDVADLCTQHLPATADHVSGWIARLRARGPAKGPPRTPVVGDDDRQPGQGTLALLARAADHDEALRFFASDFRRGPHYAMAAAELRGDHPLSRAVLRALFSVGSGVTIDLQLRAAQQAADWGDPEAARALVALEKKRESQMKRTRNL